MVTELCFTSMTDIAKQIDRGEISPLEAVDAYLQRIEQRNDELRAYSTVIGDKARAKARAAERTIERGDETGPLHGVPIAIKDLFAYKAGVRHTFGSTVFEDFVPDRTAPVVERLEDAGAIVLGKTNTPEFGNRPTTDNELVGTTRTPFDTERTAGGSSGGSAAAVADGLAAAAQGSDAGGSVRIPAACCGVYGFKPTFGRVPNGNPTNAFAEHTPFVQHGPLTRTVEDAAVLLDVMTGPHPDDPFTHPEADSSYVAAVDRSIDDLEVAYSPTLGLFTIDSRVLETVEDAVDDLATAGATVDEIPIDFDRDPDEIRDAWKTLFQVMVADIARQLYMSHGIDLVADHESEIDSLFVEIVKAGRAHSVMEYKRADSVRTDVYAAISDVFDAHDLLVTPTIAVPPFDADELGPSEVDGTDIDPFIDWILSWIFNMTDHPAASVPAGFVDDSLPIGMQLVGDRFADADVLAASGAFERQRPWHDAYPGQS
ncbi:amidase [Natronorubrum tibetense]|uniref:Glutamyl-tRNA amidotransferase subunit A n=1 Tax=Natronorubrum tibetense GA33 TaxID=1114856 RepID=L9VKM8_9EURY|nr:amidase [Natronorubrum tibetense]ELY37765.1 glutamyl-tRNA amidotransferase subunit A [Natronorubrum tibetense GA33]